MSLIGVQAGVRGLDLVGQCRRQVCRADPFSNLCSDASERGNVVDVEAGKRLVDAFVEAVGLEEFAVGEGGGCEAARNPDARRRKLADHLAERGVLAADALDIGHPQVIEPDHPLLLGFSPDRQPPRVLVPGTGYPTPQPARSRPACACRVPHVAGSDRDPDAIPLDS